MQNDTTLNLKATSYYKPPRILNPRDLQDALSFGAVVVLGPTWKPSHPPDTLTVVFVTLVHGPKRGPSKYGFPIGNTFKSNMNYMYSINTTLIVMLGLCSKSKTI